MKAIGLLSSLAFAAACTTSAPPASSTVTGQEPSSHAADDSTLVVGLGATQQTADGQVTVSFLKLESDSRCPANAVCVWQGDAATTLRVHTRGNDVEATIHTTLEPKLLEAGGVTLLLLEVRPYPGTTERPVTPSVVVRVRR